VRSASTLSPDLAFGFFRTGRRTAEQGEAGQSAPQQRAVPAPDHPPVPGPAGEPALDVQKLPHERVIAAVIANEWPTRPGVGGGGRFGPFSQINSLLEAC
jgi:hypothetical protein